MRQSARNSTLTRRACRIEKHAVIPSPASFRSLLILVACACLPVKAKRIPVYEQPPTRYSTTDPQDEVTRLRERLDRGELAFVGDERQVLRAVLDALQVPASSQVIVFSKTSLQRRRIRPDTPRALYFSDTVYVGWVPGGLIEVAAVDSKLGPVFYALDPRAADQARRTFGRDDDCLRCHGDHFVRDVPALFARSVVPDATGEPLLQHGTKLVDDQTPFEERWGGWYVTGYNGALDHQGNAWADGAGGSLMVSPGEPRPTELSGYFNTTRYLTGTSDVVALLVMEHQMAMQNSLTAASQRCQNMLVYQQSLLKAFKEPETGALMYDSVKSVFASAAEEVVDHLLFRNAAPVPSGVTGLPAFREDFTKGAPRSAAGHALKDFQLRDRLFANRCSYLIYSDTFAALPEPLKGLIFDRLLGALHETGPDGRYAYLEPAEKKRIYEILLETHPDARARWSPGGITAEQIQSP